MISKIIKIDSLGIIRIIFIASLILSGCKGCNNGANDKVRDKRLVAEYNGDALYMYQLDKYVPEELSGNDSIEFANTFINDWATGKAIEEKAKEEISNLEENIEPELEAAKTTMIRREFTEWLIEKNLDTVVQYQQMYDYYKKYPDKFKSNGADYYQIFYIKTLNSNTSQVVSWMSSNKEEELEKLNKWCQEGGCIEYRTDSSVVTESDLMYIAEGFYGNLSRAKLNTVHTYTNTKEGKTYTNFVRIIKVIRPGELLPFSACKDKIIGHLLNHRRNELIEQTEHTLFEEAKSKNKFKRYID
ncbi:MAG: hypothetical protein K1X92_15100 [Bacteroidia bacterium]|nr:hypothetical protein [Bacteroidia bacterium]